MADAAAPLDGAIDAGAPGLAEADLIVVFGTRLAVPARIAAELFTRGLAPLVVLTGGSARQPDGLNEAEHHRELLLAAGVPADRILVENRSTSTSENVLFALPLIEQRHPRPRSVIAVVKRHHRRALVTLARHASSIERFYAVAYDAELTPERAEEERRRMHGLALAGVDLLVADGLGWRRRNQG